jgi:diguanylate cyclase (GGDEF)-like protein
MSLSPPMVERAATGAGPAPVALDDAAERLRSFTEVVQRLRAGDPELGQRPLDALAQSLAPSPSTDARTHAPSEALTRELQALARALQGLLAGHERQLASLKAERAALEDKLHDRTHRLTAANLRLEVVMRQDALTGVANRFAFQERLQHEFVQLRRHRSPFGVIALDIDHFKKVNDTHGHAVGDEVLKAVALCARAGLRESDFFARTGGEEFIALLPHTEGDGVAVVAEKIRARVAALWVEPVGALTVSLGWALARPEDTDADVALKAADERLYAAKQDGRNRVCGPTDVL